MAAWFVRHGVPVDVTDDLIVQGHAFASFIRYAIDPELLYEGSEVGGWQVARASRPCRRSSRLPARRRADRAATTCCGGSRRRSGSIRRAARIRSATTSLRSSGRSSSRRASSIRATGSRSTTRPTRARELIEHHRLRLDEHEAPLSTEPRTAYEVSLDVFGRELAPTQRRFAVAETLSHLERLVREGRAARSGDDNRVSYTSP